MKKSELIQAIKEALLPEIDKMLTKKVAAAAKKIIQENRKHIKPAVTRYDKPKTEAPNTSLASLMEEHTEPNPVAQTFKKKTFTKNKMLNSILNETAEQQQEWKSTNGTGFTSDMAQSFRAANPLDAFGGGKPTAQQMIPADRQGRDVPEAVSNALTRDYSDLMKAINKKKG